MQVNQDSGGEQGIPLCGGTTPGVVRIGDTVRRPLDSRSPFVHALLLHLETAGVAWAPRFLGIDAQGREVLTFLEGDVPHEAREWPDEHLRILVGMVRQLHEATAGSPLAGSSEVVCHNDLAPWNTVLQQGVPVALLDFGAAAPGSRLEDLGYFFWVFLGLGAGRSALQEGVRMRLLCDAYGLGDRRGLLAAVEQQQRRILAFREQQARASPSAATRAWAAGRVEEIGRDIQWLREHRAQLSRGLFST